MQHEGPVSTWILFALAFGFVFALTVGNQVSVMLTSCSIDTDLSGREEVVCSTNWFAFTVSTVATFLVWVWGVVVVQTLTEIRFLMRRSRGNDEGGGG